MYNVSGRSVEELLNLDKETFNNLTPKDLRAITSRLVSAVNKRIRRLEAFANKEGGIEIPSLRSLSKRGIRQFSIKNASDEDVITTYANIKDFMNFETSSITNYKKLRKEIDKKVSEATGFDYANLPKNEKDEIWNLYATLRETNHGIMYEEENGNYRQKSTNGIVVQAIYSMMNSPLTKDQILDKLNDLVETMYAKDKTDEEIKEEISNDFSIIR